MSTEQLSALETQLREKEQLVSALTERLEQAAEQLDRIRRSGGDRVLRTGGGIPPELVEEQRTLVTELQQAVQQWADMQPGATLGRIEVQITELRDLVSGRLPDGGFQGSQQSDRSSSTQPERGRPQKSQAGNAYEAMKAQLLDAAPPAQQPPEAKKPAAPAAAAAPVEEIVPVDAPETVNLEAAGVDELRKAVEQRDTYISYLLRKLRAAEMCNENGINWEALNNAPEDLRRRLEDLEKTLHATLRHAEIDHSLERARLAREAMRLEQQEDLIRREMKRLNLSDGKEGDEDSGEGHHDHHESSANTRWQRLFGKR